MPATVTFNAGETSQPITFAATQDAVDDDGESVLLGFGTSLPSRVSAGATDCTAQGAICTSDGRKLSSRVELTISGPSE